MPQTTPQLGSISTHDLNRVTGGAPAEGGGGGGLDVAAIGGQIGQLVDSFTGGKNGAKFGGNIGSLIKSFMGGASPAPAAASS